MPKELVMVTVSMLDKRRMRMELTLDHEKAMPSLQMQNKFSETLVGAYSFSRRGTLQVIRFNKC